MASPATHLERTRSGMQARGAAVRALILAHTDEFEQLHGDAREAAGLPREKQSNTRTPQTLRAQIERARNRVAKWEAELAAMNGNGASA